AGAVIAIGLASVELCLMSIPAAIVGAETRLSRYLIIEFVFGRKGSDYVNALLALTLLGWFAVTAGFFGETLALAFEEFLAASPPVWLLTLISSLLIIATTIYGFKAIDRLALFAVPLLILFMVYVASLSLENGSIESLLAIQGQDPDYFPTAVSTIIGSLIVGVVLMPDLTRYARTRFDCVSASVLGNGVGNAFSMMIAVLPAVATGLLDPMGYMIFLGLVGSAFVILVFATWTTNSVNLYSTVLAVAIIKPKTAEWRLTVICGVIGTALAMVGIADYFVEFLEWLGVIVPPVAGVYLTDYFILQRKAYALSLLERVPDYDTAALVTWLSATLLSVLAFWFDTSISGIVSLDALLVTIPIYLLCLRIWPTRFDRKLNMISGQDQT
ncbi:MAG: cytosine permease, partial [Gammaproteobacteria bacterium]|nr:cytosine permease [Gammaproteobacteria bacterium]